MMNKYLGKLSGNVFLLLFTIVILLISIGSMYQPVYINLVFNVIMPIAVLLTLKMVFFEKMKLSTLVVMRTLIVLAAFNLFDGDLYVKIVMVFLAINILEATVTDFKIKKYYNVITGIVLTLTIPLITATWLGVYYTATTANVIGIVCWIVAYTIWNFIFVTNEFSASVSKLHVGILATPLISMVLLGNPGFWLLIRANSLTIGGVIQIANKQFVEDKLESSAFAKFVAATKKDSAQIAFMIINLVLLGVMVYIHFMKVGI